MMCSAVSTRPGLRPPAAAVPGGGGDPGLPVPGPPGVRVRVTVTVTVTLSHWHAEPAVGLAITATRPPWQIRGPGPP